MKAILKFDFPEDEDEFTLAQHGKDFALALWDLDNGLRSLEKSGENVDIDTIIKVRDLLIECMEKYDVHFGMIT